MSRRAFRQDNRPTPPAVARRVHRRGARSRRGTAVTELAVCLPMLTLIVFGSIQACNLIYLKHGVVTAAYEGTLELAKKRATTASVTARAQQVLSARGIKSARIRITPGNPTVESASIGAVMTIEVSADVRPNMPLSGFFAAPAAVTGRVVGTR